MKYFIFGTGYMSDFFCHYIEKDDILCFLDNDLNKQGDMFLGKKVFAPEDVNYEDADKIIVLIMNYKNVVKQLEDYGVAPEKIKTYVELNNLLKWPIKINKNGEMLSARELQTELRGQKVLLLSHDLSRTGVPVANMHMAELFREMDWTVLVGSLWGGTLEEDLHEKGIPFINNLYAVEINDTFEDFINQFDFILISTLTFAKFADRLSFYDKPIIWWLNESYVHEYEEYILPEHSDNLFYFADGPTTVNLFERFYPDREIHSMFYYLPDDDEVFSKFENKDYIQFTMVGSMSKRKAPDVFLAAIHHIEKNKRQKCKFLMIGTDKTELIIDWDKEKKDIPQLEHINEVSQAELIKIYSETDVLVCPSREDTEPIVVTQAFQNSIPCIVSNNVGQAAFMQNGCGGYVFENENIQNLACIMMNCIDNYEEAKIKGKKGKYIFDKYFSKTAIKKVVEKEIINNILNMK